MTPMTRWCRVIRGVRARVPSRVPSLVLLVSSVIAPLPPRTALGQRVTYDSARQSWTLRSGPVAYRLVTRDGQVVLDYFGPAAAEGPATRVARSYPRVPAPALGGFAEGERLDTASVRVVMQTVMRMGGRSVLLAYRLQGGAAAEAFRLRGLRPDVRYAVFDASRDGEPLQVATGAELASTGVRVALDDEWRAAAFELVPRP